MSESDYFTFELVGVSIETSFFILLYVFLREKREETGNAMCLDYILQ